MITAYLYNSCSSCRKVVDLLRESGANVEVREFFKEKMSRGELKSLLSTTGLKVNDVLSTRSTPYRTLDLANRNLSDDEIIDLMLDEPRLLKRPILLSGPNVVVGYKADQIQKLIRQDSEA